MPKEMTATFCASISNSTASCAAVTATSTQAPRTSDLPNRNSWTTTVYLNVPSSSDSTSTSTSNNNNSNNNNVSKPKRDFHLQRVVLPEVVRYFEFPRRSKSGKKSSNGANNNKSAESRNAQGQLTNSMPSGVDSAKDVNGNIRMNAQLSKNAEMSMLPTHLTCAPRERSNTESSSTVKRAPCELESKSMVFTASELAQTRMPLATAGNNPLTPGSAPSSTFKILSVERK